MQQIIVVHVAVEDPEGTEPAKVWQRPQASGVQPATIDFEINQFVQRDQPPQIAVVLVTDMNMVRGSHPRGPTLLEGETAYARIDRKAAVLLRPLNRTYPTAHLGPNQGHLNEQNEARNPGKGDAV